MLFVHARLAITAASAAIDTKCRFLVLSVLSDDGFSPKSQTVSAGNALIISEQKRCACHAPLTRLILIVRGLPYMTSTQKGEGSKIPQICGQTVHKVCEQRGDEVKKSTNLWTSYMDCPLPNPPPQDCPTVRPFGE